MATEPRVELTHLPDMTLVGYGIRVAGAGEIPAFWERFFREDLRSRLPEPAIPGLLVGACWDEAEDGSFHYLIGVVARREAAAGEGQTRLDLPAARRARVTVRGEMGEAIPLGFRWFHREWLPASGLRPAPGAELEWYDHRTCDGPQAEVDLLIPVE